MTTLYFVGDLQRTTRGERLLGRENNDAERARLLAALARDMGEARAGAGTADETAIYYLGDLVAVGGWDGDWRRFDEMTKAVRATGARESAIYGNHDYFPSVAIARRAMGKRFPGLDASSWGVDRFGPLAVLRLDTNRRFIGSAAWSAQLEWLRAEIARLDGDPGVRGWIALGHHPPYSNSARTEPSAWVRDEWVPRFRASRKFRAMLSGHCHAYERFSVDGAAFIVSGGGGGSRVPLLHGAESRWTDLYAAPSPRPFHYLRMEIGADALRVDAIGFQGGESAHRLETFRIQL